MLYIQPLTAAWIGSNIVLPCPVNGHSNDNNSVHHEHYYRFTQLFGMISTMAWKFPIEIKWERKYEKEICVLWGSFKMTPFYVKIKTIICSNSLHRTVFRRFMGVSRFTQSVMRPHRILVLKNWTFYSITIT